MAQARLNATQIEERQNQIGRLEAQIKRWEALGGKDPGLVILREAMKRAITVEEKNIIDRVKTLSFSSDADKLDLSKCAGKLTFAESIYYDISEASQKIDGANQRIAQLASEIKRAKAGELIEVGQEGI